MGLISSFLGGEQSGTSGAGSGYETVQALGNTGAAKTITTTGTFVTGTLTANCTLTFPTPTDGQAYSFTLELTQDGTGGRTVTWPSSVKWASGSVPTLTSTAGRTDVFAFESRDGGVTWLGFVSGQNYNMAAAGSATPTSVSGLLFWYNPDGSLWKESSRSTAATADGDEIGAWDDASSNADHATQGVAGLLPILKTGVNGVDGHNVVRFDGTNDQLTATGAEGGRKPFTFFALVKLNGTSQNGTVIGGPVGGIQVDVNASAGQVRLMHQSTALIGAKSTALADATATILCVSYSGTGVWTWYTKANVANGTGTQNVTPTSGTLYLGAADGSSTFFKGDMGDVFMFDSVLGSSDRQSMLDYLTSKYPSAA